MVKDRNMNNLNQVLTYLFLNEAHFGKFNMDVFKRLPDLKSRYKYAKKNLRSIGAGSSREAFALSTNSVLKVALLGVDWRRGFAQNKAEVDIWTNPKTKTVAARIFDFDGKRYEWLIMEPAQEISYKTFKEILQLPPFVQKDDAINVIDFLKIFFDYVYTIPQKILNSKNKLEELEKRKKEG